MAWEKINDVCHNPYDYFGIYDVVRQDTFSGWTRRELGARRIRLLAGELSRALQVEILWRAILETALSFPDANLH